jgi:N6-L-threonylcarbamoyladenine synthase
MAASVETAICEVLVKKSVRACNQEGVKSLVIAGGVAANRCLRSMLTEESESHGIEIYLPPAKYCTDNAAMICYAGFQRRDLDNGALKNWDVKPKWSLSD